MIVSVLARRPEEACTFEDFVRAWEDDAGFGIPTRVFNAQNRVRLHVQPRTIGLGSAESLLDALGAAGVSEATPD